MALQIARPTTGRQYPSRVLIDAQALFQILSHSLRRQTDQARVIGTLVGVRNDDGTEVHVKTAYIVPIAETEDEVKIDIDYHREMLQLIRRVHRDSAILGWYATSSTLNNLSALIHDFYSQENGSFPWPAIHLTLQTTKAADLDIRTYISSPVGVQSEAGANFGNCIFLPVAHVVEYTEVDKEAMNVVTEAAGEAEREAYILPLKENVDHYLTQVVEQIGHVQRWVATARENPTSESEAVGRYLYRALSAAPVAADSGVSTYMRDLMLIVRLTESVKRQLDTASELTALTAYQSN